MPLKELKTEWTPKIEAALDNTIEAQDFESSEGVREMLRYHMGWASESSPSGAKGKRIRPLITLFMTGAFGQDPSDALPGAVSIELLHNFTLIHDDIEDHSPQRHGRPTIWKKWGVAQAINTGDALFSIAELSMLNLVDTLSPRATLDAARELNRTCLKLIRGQYLDLSFESAESVETATYLNMIAGKTAALIGFACQLGAMVAGQSDLMQSQAADYGRNLGLAFQIIDDDLGIWGDPAITGKSTASDILARKKSLPVLYGLASSVKFRQHWQKETLTTEDVSEMSELLVEIGAQARVRQASARFTKKANQALEQIFPQPNHYAQALFELTKVLLTRRA
ncbi:MAG: polyprenyl synthetase family protein [Chloroflexota bacterium]|nr:polyprenyl synthetase family protein [Chloroflexota bacterium]